MSGYIGKRERKRRQETDTRHLIGVQALTEYGLVTYGQETLVYFLIKPANLSVLSEASIGRRIYALMTVLKGVAEVEMLCLNSRESFEENKLFLRRRAGREDIKRLLAVYYEQNVTTEKFEDFDGERWIIQED